MRQADDEEADNDIFPAKIPPRDQSQILEGDLESNHSCTRHVTENQNFNTVDALSDENKIVIMMMMKQAVVKKHSARHHKIRIH